MKKNYLPLIAPGIIFLVGVSFLIYTYYKNITNKPAALSVTSKYNEAQVNFRGEDIGETPVEQTELSSGRGEVILKTKNNEFKKEVILTQESLTVVAVDVGISDTFSGNLIIWYDKLANNDAELFIASNPTESSVEINDKYYGETPLTIMQNDLPEGAGNEYTITIQKEGYETQKLTVALEKGYTLNISASMFLKPIPEQAEKLEETSIYNLYGLGSEQMRGISAAEWASAIKYWLETRGIVLFGSENISYFDYFIDREGNLYSGAGDSINKDTFKLEEMPEKNLVIGYLNTQENELTNQAKETLSSITVKNENEEDNNTNNENNENNESADTSNYTVTETGIGYLNVRSKPNINGELLGQLQVGEKVEVLDKQDEWYKITFEGEEAWVYSTYLQELK